MKQDLYELLNEMKKRPAMWLRIPTIYSLEAFLSGFDCAQLSGPSAWPPLWLLHDWTAHKFGQGSSGGWAYILAQQCQGDEKAALHLFFELLEEFKELQVIRVLEIQLDSAAYAFYWSEECKVQRYAGADSTRLPPPSRVCVMQLSGGLGFYVFHYTQEQRLNKESCYSSLRACLRALRAEFGPTIAWKEADSSAISFITDLL